MNAQTDTLFAGSKVTADSLRVVYETRGFVDASLLQWIEFGRVHTGLWALLNFVIITSLSLVLFYGVFLVLKAVALLVKEIAALVGKTTKSIVEAIFRIPDRIVAALMRARKERKDFQKKIDAAMLQAQTEAIVESPEGKGKRLVVIALDPTTIEMLAEPYVKFCKPGEQMDQFLRRSMDTILLTVAVSHAQNEAFWSDTNTQDQSPGKKA